MKDLSIGQELPPYNVIGKNYATDHDNKIHSDDVAAQYGFAGGLVPGVGIYAYLTQPLVNQFGRELMTSAAIKAKFLKPIYENEKIWVRTRISETGILQLKTELFNSSEILCAIAETAFPQSCLVPDPLDYPFQSLPNAEEKSPANIDFLPPGKILGSLDWKFNLAEIEAEFLDKVCATAPIYRGAEAICHPAFYLAQANEILMANVKLGPWIHTGSEVQHYDLPTNLEQLSLRGKIAKADERRGHQIVVLDLGLFGNELRPIAQIKHSAIIRLKEPGRWNDIDNANQA